MIHDGPLVVHVCPGTTTSYHFEDDAPEGPDVDGAVAPEMRAPDDLGRHVHWGAGHGALAALTRGGVFGGEGAALAGDYFCGAEVDEFDDAVVVEEDV